MSEDSDNPNTQVPTPTSGVTVADRGATGFRRRLRSKSAVSQDQGSLFDLGASGADISGEQSPISGEQSPISVEQSPISGEQSLPDGLEHDDRELSAQAHDLDVPSDESDVPDPFSAGSRESVWDFFGKRNDAGSEISSGAPASIGDSEATLPDTIAELYERSKRSRLPRAAAATGVEGNHREADSDLGPIKQAVVSQSELANTSQSDSLQSVGDDAVPVTAEIRGVKHHSGIPKAAESVRLFAGNTSFGIGVPSSKDASARETAGEDSAVKDSAFRNSALQVGGTDQVDSASQCVAAEDTDADEASADEGEANHEFRSRLSELIDFLPKSGWGIDDLRSEPGTEIVSESISDSSGQSESKDQDVALPVSPGFPTSAPGIGLDEAPNNSVFSNSSVASVPSTPTKVQGTETEPSSANFPLPDVAPQPEPGSSEVQQSSHSVAVEPRYDLDGANGPDDLPTGPSPVVVIPGSDLVDEAPKTRLGRRKPKLSAKANTKATKREKVTLLFDQDVVAEGGSGSIGVAKPDDYGKSEIVKDKSPGSAKKTRAKKSKEGDAVKGKALNLDEFKRRPAKLWRRSEPDVLDALADIAKTDVDYSSIFQDLKSDDSGLKADNTGTKSDDSGLKAANTGTQLNEPLKETSEPRATQMPGSRRLTAGTLEKAPEVAAKKSAVAARKSAVEADQVPIAANKGGKPQSEKLDELAPIVVDGAAIQSALEKAKAAHKGKLSTKPRRNHLITFVAALLSVLLVVGIGLYSAISGSPAKAPKAAPVVLKNFLPYMLVVNGGSAQADSIMVFMPNRTSKGGSILLIPSGTMTQVVPGGELTLASALTPEQGVDPSVRMKNTVENLLGVSMGGIAVVNDQQFAQLVQPAGNIEVNLPDPIGGGSTQSFAAGPNTITPSQSGAFLAASDQTGELGQLDRLDLFLHGWFKKMSSDPSAVPSTNIFLSTTFMILAKGAIQIQVLPVNDMGQQVNGGDLFSVDNSALPGLVKSTFPSPARAVTPRATVQLLNGTGQLGVDATAMNKIVPTVSVTLSGNAATFNYPATQIVYYDSKGKAAATQIQSELGVGNITQASHPSGIVDVTVIIGADFHG